MTLAWYAEGFGKFNRYKHLGPFDTEREAQERAAVSLLRDIRVYTGRKPDDEVRGITAGPRR